MRVVDDHAAKQRFCDRLMAKYRGRDVGRPKGFYPRLDHITVYAIEARDRTKTPDATAPQAVGSV